MCGILGVLTSNNKCVKLLINGIKQLENRGYDSAGICTLKSDFSVLKVASNKNIDSIDYINKNYKLLNDSNIGIAHTRWATHGGKTDINSHPHLSYNNKFALVHNGIIENYDIIKKMLINKGIKFKSQTDSEVIVNLLAYNYEKYNDIIISIEKTIDLMKGTWALSILCKEYPNKLFCTRYGSPLLISENDNMVIITSEQSGFNGLVNNYIILDNNDICEISCSDDNICKINTKHEYKKKNIYYKNFDLTPEPYLHWTIKEIHEQYESSLRAINFGGRLLNDNKVKLKGFDYNSNELKTIDNLILLGCGTSYYAGLLGINYFKDLCNFNTIQIYDGAEFTKKDIPNIGKTALLLLSQSGETKDLHRCISIGKENNLFLIGVINVVDSMIAREVNCVCYLNAGREVAVASTKSFTSQSIILSMIAIWFSQIHNINFGKRKEYINCLRNLSNDIKKTIEISKKNKDIINIIDKPNLFILGKGETEAIAKEGSLKIKEITYIHAEGYSSSSLKHGPFALLNKNFPVIIIAIKDNFYNKNINAYEQVKSRNSPIIFITDNSECKYDNKLIIPFNKIYGSLLSIIPIQLFSYYLAIKKNINPDKPRNLAKVVTVE
tara:strand:+ start:94 stop:1923 length:1830 start_codon:yes stop_codon:yes gene_type:complete